MAFDAIRKELQRVVCTCYLACPAVALCGGGKVTGACPAVALCEGGKTLPLSDRSEGALTILRSFEIASFEPLFRTGVFCPLMGKYNIPFLPL